jgi:hypothetical protein
MPDAESLNLFVRSTDRPNQFKVAVDDPGEPSNIVDFVLSGELSTALLKLHARGANRILRDIPSQDVVSSFIGESLYNTFIMGERTNPVSSAFHQFFERYGAGPHRLALHLPRSLYFLPWELLRNPSDPSGHFFSLFHSVVRVDGEARGPDPRDTRFPPSEPTLQLLFVVADPSNKPIGDFEPAETGDVRFFRVIPATYNNFQAFTSKKDIEPDGFIFFGHGDVGDDYGRLVFVKQQGVIFRTLVSDPRPGYSVGTDLYHRLKLRFGCLLACDTAWISDKLPFLNSVVGSILDRSKIPFVLGCQTPIAIGSAQEFLSGMVEALQKKEPLDFAITHGRRTVHASPPSDTYTSLDWWVPVLYSKSTYFQILPEQPPIVIPAATRGF